MHDQTKSRLIRAISMQCLQLTLGEMADKKTISVPLVRPTVLSNENYNLLGYYS